MRFFSKIDNSIDQKNYLRHIKYLFPTSIIQLEMKRKYKD